MSSETPAHDRYLGAGARLAAGPADALAHTAFAFELESATVLWRGLGRADRAHVAALVDAGVVTVDVARRLIDGIEQLDDMDVGSRDLDPYIGDVHNNRDAMLEEYVGSAAGALNTARARREATTIAWQIACRERLVDLAKGTVGLLTALLDVSGDHRGSLMPDFTYLQHAHPTTLGHYLLGFAYPVWRAVDRMLDVFALVNRSPAGSGSVNGTPIPVDRELLAELLEFDGLVTHTRDAMWAPDMALQQVNAVVDVAVTLDRLAEELQIWSTEEFGFVELADEHTRTSVIMPQKKNPYSLAFIRGASRRAIGLSAAQAAVMMTPTGQPDNRIFSYVQVPSALSESAGLVDLLAEVLLSATFETGRMRTSATKGFTYSTDLCDLLVVDHGLDNRTAHQIIGAAVRSAIESGAASVTAGSIARSAGDRGIAIEISEDEVERVIDVDTLIASRIGIGGAADGPLDAMFAELRGNLASARNRLAGIDYHDFDERLDTRVEMILDGRETS